MDKKAEILVVVDMQRDFVDAALGTREAVAILPAVVAKIEEYKARGGVIIATQDTHEENYMDTSEGKHLPVIHCVRGTDGWQLHPAVAAALPDHGEDFDRIRALNEARRERFARALTGLGARVYPSDANFLLCDFGRDMRPAVARLRDKKILLRPCHMFPGLTTGHIRLCVRSEAENGTLVEAVNACLSRSGRSRG